VHYAYSFTSTQILVRLLAKMNGTRERIEAKIGAEIKTIRKNMDSDQEKAETCRRKMEAEMGPH
jgi:hypothetical protein